jgi:hypothetical protein
VGGDYRPRGTTAVGSALLAALGIEPMEMTPATFDAFIKMQIGIDAELVRTAGLKAQ